MSRLYEISVFISGFDKKNEWQIEDACDEEWSFKHWDRGTRCSDSAYEIVSTAQNNLCGGESEEEFARRLTHAIWSANNGFCTIEVQATCLEDLPYEYYVFSEDEFERVKDLILEEDDEEY